MALIAKHCSEKKYLFLPPNIILFIFGDLNYLTTFRDVFLKLSEAKENIYCEPTNQAAVVKFL